METEKKLPSLLRAEELDTELRKICTIIEQLADRDIFIWLDSGRLPSEEEIRRAASVVADRLCRSMTDPILRNAQESRQLQKIGDWLTNRDYRLIPRGSRMRFDEMQPGTYAFRMNVPAQFEGTAGRTVNIPVDVVVMRKTAQPDDLPVLIEAKSAGDFTNVNKRRKEEAQKIRQLRARYGEKVEFILCLCGYFNSGDLGYEAAERIDWVWEHRISDLAELDL